MQTEYRGTTICAVRRGGKVAIAGDGQVTHADMILKAKARKIRTLADGAIVAGFAGSVADALTLFERFEGKLKQFKELRRAAVELAKEWRTDKYLRRLEALLLACDRETTLLISGTGDVIEPDEDFAAIGTGAGYALAAAKALGENKKLSAEEIARRALEITAEICIYTNAEIVVESLD
jgi:ATP-dependent HslUV protease subunit HslV